MANQILINYEAVYAKCRELRNRMSSEVHNMDAGYRQLQSSLGRMDGSTNAAIMETMAVSQQRSVATVDTFQELLTAIESAARETEQEEQRISHVFNSLSSNRTEGGTN